jgi:uncharacterized membrane protein YfcA
MLLDAISTASPTLLFALAASLVVAGTVKGTIGVGMPIVALPLLSAFVEVRAAVALLSLPLVLSNIPQAVENGAAVARLKRLFPVLIGMIPGIAAGVQVLATGADPRQANAAAGLALILAAVLMLAAPKLHVRTTAIAAGVAVGFLGGLMGGVAAIPGPLVFAFLLAKGLRGNEFTGEASMFLVVSSLALAIGLAGTGGFDWRDALVSAAALIPVAIGMYLGQKVRDRIAPETFKRLVLLAVLVSGFELVRRAAFA